MLPKKEKFIFCTLRDFKTDVGETLRIYGIVNALATAGHEIVLISNASSFGAFHPAVQQVAIQYKFKSKRLLQALASILPARLLRIPFHPLFRALERALQQAGARAQTVFFFDYLDNTIGYLLQQLGLVAGYVNDVHGIATIEFLSNKEKAHNRYQKALFQVKHWSANQLDKKVFGSARGFLYGSSAMQDYFEGRYTLKGKETLVLPYLLDAFAIAKAPDPALTKSLAGELGLVPEHFVFMFVGSYKSTAGTGDLIAAFTRLYGENASCRLVLIGGGTHRPEGEMQAQGGPAAAAIQFLDSVPYSKLPAYYAFAQVIVCPDRDNPFSQYVVHIKYLDALATGKLVINGAFRSVLEINAAPPLSLLFQPSSQEDLYQKMKEACWNYAALTAQYQHAAAQVKCHFTYAAFTAPLAALATAVQS